MRTVTKATDIQFINGKCHIMKQKSHKIVLSGYYTCVSCDLLLMASGADTHTHTHTYQRTNKNDFKKPGMRSHRPREPGLKMYFESLCLGAL